MVIDIDKRIGCCRTVFPDGATHWRLESPPVVTGFTADVRARIRNGEDLWSLLSVCNAVRRANGRLGRLDLPYVVGGGRYDRVMVRGDAVDVQVMSDAINSCGFRHVRVFEPHSDVIQLIRGVDVVDNEALVRALPAHGKVLIVPDAGAAKRADRCMAWNNFSASVQCVKHRDVATGKVSLAIPEAGWLNGADICVIDDLCDGGATFNAIIDCLDRANSKPKSSILCVSHGVFSKGVDALKYDSVFTTDSYCNLPSSGKLTVIQSPI